jgi:hypothetical protein
LLVVKWYSREYLYGQEVVISKDTGKRISPRHTPRAVPGKPGLALGEDWPDAPGEEFNTGKGQSCNKQI